MALWDLCFFWGLLNANIKTHPLSSSISMRSRRCIYWRGGVPGNGRLYGFHICLPSHYRPLHPMWLHCCLTGSHTVTPPSFPLHLHRHGNSSHRGGEPVHRKLGVWQDKTERSSDTVPRQPVRAAQNNKTEQCVRKGTCWYECNGHISCVTLYSPIDCKHLSTIWATSTVTFLQLLREWHYLSIWLPAVFTVRLASTYFTIILQNADRKMCGCRPISYYALWVSTSACADNVLLRQLYGPRKWLWNP